MRFSIQLPTDRVAPPGEFTSGAALSQMARAVEDAGFDAAYVTEHPMPDDAWLSRGGHHALDPFVSLTAAAMATTTLRLHTNILVLAYRNPFLTAKSVASLDVLSEGRVLLGVAAGYLEGEYRALGADFEHRNEVTDEALVAMKRAWTGESVVLAGRHFEARGNTTAPVPVQQPHPPIWIGGNSGLAMRRVVAHAQGWSPFPLAARFASGTRTAAIEDIGQLRAKIDRLRALAKEAGRSDAIDVNFVPFGREMNARTPLDPGAFREECAAYAEAGVTWLSIGLPFSTRQQYLASIGRFSRDVIAKL